MKKLMLNLIGILFIVLGLISFSRIFFVASVWQNLFWWCNHVSIIFGLAILFRSTFWLTAELNIALIPQILWSFDFFSKLFFNKFIFGFTAYMFDGYWTFKLLSYQHLFMFILALIALFMIGEADKKAWIGSFIHGILLFIAGFFISANYNINCVHQNCLGFPIDHYIFAWFAGFALMVLLTNFILVKITKFFK